METKKKVIPIIAMDHVSKQYSTGVEAQVMYPFAFIKANLYS